jgi:hypothetical protein
MDGFKKSTSRPAPSVCRFLQQNRRKAAVGKQAKQNGGRYSAGLLTAPRPLRHASPSPTLQIHHILRWSMRMVPAMVFLFGHLSIM